MSLKQRVGNFLLLMGFIGLLIFGASVIAPPGNYSIPAFLVGALLFGLGLNFRLSKPSGHPHAEAHSAPHAAPAHKSAAKPAAKGGLPAHAGPPAAAPKRQGPISGLLKGPPPKKTAPAAPPPHAGGGPPAKK